jgi:hypothetical protein
LVFNENSGFTYLVENDKIDDLKRMYTLLGRGRLDMKYGCVCVCVCVCVWYVCLFVYLFVCLFICLFVYFFFFFFFYFFFFFFSIFFFNYFYFFIYLFIYLFVCLFICLFYFILLSLVMFFWLLLFLFWFLLLPHLHKMFCRDLRRHRGCGVLHGVSSRDILGWGWGGRDGWIGLSGMSSGHLLFPHWFNK